ncbi:hypothetical protein G6F31_013845 [Rhizopus arrhizus]|nr:hypothetical protein G6F31_013845 [Rhizopus arrhizus]
MRADHHHLIGLAAAADLGQRVVTGLVGFVSETRGHVHAQAHGLLGLQRAHQRVEVFADHRQLGDAHRFTGLARTTSGNTDDAVVPAADADRGQRAFFDEERIDLARQRLALLVFLDPLGALGGGVLVLGQGEFLQAFQRGGVVAMRICLGTALVLARLAQQQDPATQLAAVLLDVFGLLDLDLHQFAFHRAVRTRRPGLGQRMQRLDAVAQHFHAGRGELPATAEIIEGVVVDVVQLPFVELAAGPGVGAAHRRGIGQARADALCEVAEGVHHLRTMEGLLADAADHVQVHRLALLRPCIAPHRQRYGQHAPLQPAPLKHAAPLPFGSIINPSSLASRGAAIPSHRSWAVRKRGGGREAAPR